MYQLYGRAPQTPSEFDMPQSVQEVLTLLDRVARKRDVSVRAETASAATRVRLPEGEVKQILYDLILNAIQASPAGETVTVQIAGDRDSRGLFNRPPRVRRAIRRIAGLAGRAG